MRAGADVTVADITLPVLPEGIKFINANDKELVSQHICTSWCVVSATGLAGVLAPNIPELLACDALIANMGVEDEFSPALPSSRVLNNKQPLNFMLDEPTSLCYIDPSMALSNAALVQLISGKMPPGVSQPPSDLEESILDDIRHAGLLNDDIDFILKGGKL
jgi:adenosylhomocysteinase